MKLLQLLENFATHPSDIWQRVEGFVDNRLGSMLVSPPEYCATTFESAVQNIGSVLRCPLRPFLDEPALAEAEERIRFAIQTLPANLPFAVHHNADFLLGRMCYGTCRALRPKIVVETGVCYGVTSAFLLRAMMENGGGVLHSIDLPPLGNAADDWVGRLVPPAWRGSWILHRGTSKSLLPLVLQGNGAVSLFVHDSLHTYRNIRRELTAVTSSLTRPAVVLADDIEGNPAFLQWAQTSHPAYWGIVREADKSSMMGVGVFKPVDVPLNSHA